MRCYLFVQVRQDGPESDEDGLIFGEDHVSAQQLDDVRHQGIAIDQFRMSIDQPVIVENESLLCSFLPLLADLSIQFDDGYAKQLGERPSPFCVVKLPQCCRFDDGLFIGLAPTTACRRFSFA